MRYRCPRIIGRIIGRMRLIPATMLFFGVLTLPGCTIGASGPRHLDWLYTVPRGYMGFLVVRFMCPGGPPLRVIRDVAEVDFAADGVACVGDAFTPWQGIVAAEDSGHRFIPVRNTVASLRPPGDERGYALFDEPNEERNGYMYMVAWVGETQVYDQYRVTDAFDRDLGAFLSTVVDSRRATPGPIP